MAKRTLGPSGGFGQPETGPAEISPVRWKTADDSSAPSGCGLDPNSSTVQLDQALDQRQTQAYAQLPSAAFKFPDHVSLIRLPNVGPCVGHDQQQLRVSALCFHRYPAARWREFDRVGDQVEKRLL